MKDIEKVIDILRKATKAVKIAPFAFAAIFILSMLAYLFLNETLSSFVDLLFYVSPISVVFILILSKIFRMCIWHKIECFLPILPIISILVDSFIYSFGVVAVYVNWGVITTLFLASLVNAYFVFIKPSSDEESNS